MGQFGKIGSISINELNSILLSLTCRNEELYLAASPDKDDTPVSSAADLYRHQARVWDAMRKQLESIVWCVSDLQNTELYQNRWKSWVVQMGKNLGYHPKRNRYLG